MRRIRNRAGWFVLIAVAGMAAIIIGRQWLFQGAACPRLQEVLLYSSAVLSAIAIAFYALVTKHDSPMTQLTTSAMVLAIGLLTPAIVGTLLSNNATFREQFCPSCQDALARARRFHSEHRLDVAEAIVRQVLQDCVDKESRMEAGRLLATVLFESAGASIERNICAGVASRLDEAEKWAREYEPILVVAIQERTKTYQRACPPPTVIALVTPTPSPTATRTPTPTPLPPTPTVDFTIPCNRATVRISQVAIRDGGSLDVVSVIPRLEIPLPRTGLIEFYGAAFMKDRVSYEIRYASVDIVGLPREQWRTLGPRKPAPVGDEFNSALLGRWEENERNSLPAGRYALTIRMFLADGNYTLESDFERCWTFVAIR